MLEVRSGVGYRPTGRSARHPLEAGRRGRCGPPPGTLRLVGPRPIRPALRRDPLSPATPLVEPARSADAAPSSRERILDTAEALFARRGFEGVGLREVARQAGLSKSALFHHFPSKVDLYAAVLERILGDLLDAIAGLDERPRPLARLLALVETIVDALAASPTRAPLLLRSLFEGEVLEGVEAGPADALLGRILGTTMEIMAEGVRCGDLRPIPVPHALQALVGMLAFHFASGELGDEVLGHPVYAPAEIDRFKSFVVSFVEGGLAARPTDSSTV